MAEFATPSSCNVTIWFLDRCEHRKRTGLPKPLLLPGKLVVLALWECFGYVGGARKAKKSKITTLDFNQMRKAQSRVTFHSFLK